MADGRPDGTLVVEHVGRDDDKKVGILIGTPTGEEKGAEVG
jgi:hypothetical protein